MTKWSADGDKHDRHCIVAAIAVGGAVTLFGQPALGISMALTITAWGLLFSPDLDLANTGRHQSGGCKAWHRWKRAGLGWYWKPYGYAFKHRSKFSHTLIPGTLLRILYVVLPVLLVYVRFSGFDLGILFQADQAQVVQLKALVINICVHLSCCFIADIVHLITDKIPPKDWMI